MKLLVQSDDYGFTKAVTYGALEGFDNGLLTCTGMFTNMPWAQWAAEQWKAKERPQGCLGIDFNIVSGPSVSDPKDIPHLVDQNGEFIRSGARLKDPRYQTEAGRREMFPYEETYREIRAQYDRFVQLFGKKPGYLHGHSLTHEHYTEAIHQLSRETGIPYSFDILEKYGFDSPLKHAAPSSMTKKVFDPEAQMSKDSLGGFMKYADEFLQKEYVMFIGHTGYVDAELLGLTTLSLERVRDLEAVTSPVFRKWVEDNHVELISYYDLY